MTEQAQNEGHAIERIGRALFIFLLATQFVIRGAEACDSVSGLQVVQRDQSNPGVAGPITPRQRMNPYIIAMSNGMTGVGAVAEFFLEFGDLAGSDYYWKEALDWTVAMAVDANPGSKWASVIDWPTANMNDLYGHPTTAWTAQVLAEGARRTNNLTYRNLAIQAMAWLADTTQWSPVPDSAGGGPGMIYKEDYRFPSVHWFSNTVFNQVAIGQGALTVYRVTGDANAFTVAKGIADALISCAIPDSAGRLGWRTWWPGNPSQKLWNDEHLRIERCGGSPGIVEFLADFAETFPDTMGVDYADAARRALDWIVARAVEDTTVGPNEGPAYLWPRRDGGSLDSASVTIGRGAAGIGRALLIGARKLHDPVYLQYAVGAANWLLHVSAYDPSTGARNWQPWLATSGNLDWCTGHLGIALFLGDVHDAVYDSTGDTRYGQAYLQAFEWLREQIMDTAFGPMFPHSVPPGPDPGAGTGMFSGFTTMGNYHYQSRSTLWSLPPASDVYLDALGFLANSARPDEGGLTWTMQIPFGGYPLRGYEPTVSDGRDTVGETAIKAVLPQTEITIVP